MSDMKCTHKWYNDKYHDKIMCYNPSCKEKATYIIRKKIKKCPNKSKEIKSHEWVINTDEDTWWGRKCSRCQYHEVRNY